MSKVASASLAVIAGALVVAVLLGAFALGASMSNRDGHGAGMMNGYSGNTNGSDTSGAWGRGGMIGRTDEGNGRGMMGGNWNNTAVPTSAPQPGATGFVPGTDAAPRVVSIVAGPGYAFSPSSITVQRGETVTFVVTAMGPYTHEFMVGLADAVAADSATGTVEIDGITMMQTKSVTYTFDGTGPYAYACHATGHYDAGMKGTITIVG
jgi:plastocyanin